MVGGHQYYLHQYLLSLVVMRGFKVSKLNEKIYTVDFKGQHMELGPDYVGMFYCEWPIWKKTYLPSKKVMTLDGKTVLDAGAGNGETALFYFNAGAKKVICIENSEDSVKLLEKNAKRNNWNVDIKCESFSLKHVKDNDFDFAKIDVEGAEKCLLELDRITFPCVVEAHSSEIKDALCDKFGFKPIKRQGGLTTVSNCR
ncbi:MAG: methyltransferase domain-containing protein [Thaumarchaeota archaeon]|nr:methyltransferase domain-containing protein [Nitrososphaerota archaeon]